MYRLLVIEWSLSFALFFAQNNCTQLTQDPHNPVLIAAIAPLCVTCAVMLGYLCMCVQLSFLAFDWPMHQQFHNQFDLSLFSIRYEANNMYAEAVDVYLMNQSNSSRAFTLIEEHNLFKHVQVCTETCFSL